MKLKSITSKKLDPVYVTKPYLPNKADFLRIVDQIWEDRWITNNGSLAKELNHKLQERLGANYFQWCNNGTTALQIAIKSLGLTGEVITTPFSYVATANSLMWENCTPVFADIDPDSLNIDVTKIEELITPETSAIMAVHVFSYPCDVDALSDLAEKHGLKLVYDAAHTFGSEYKGKALSCYGDIATLSFHATKAYHTVEGGGIVCHDRELDDKVSLAINHGHKYDDYKQIGINGKNSEFHAAIGLLNLKRFEDMTQARKRIFDTYFDAFSSTRLRMLTPSSFSDFTYNYAYAPVIFPLEEHILDVMQELKKNNIYPRRYFYPSLNTLEFLNPNSCTVSEDISSRILCLPMYYDLEDEHIIQVIEGILKVVAHG